MFLHFTHCIAFRADLGSYNFNNRLLAGRKVSYCYNSFLILFQYIITYLLVTTLGIHVQNCCSYIFSHDSKHVFHPSANILFNPTSAFTSGNHRIFMNLFMLPGIPVITGQ